MYPSAKDPSYGTFVKITSDLLSAGGMDVRTIALCGRSGKMSTLFKYLLFWIKSFVAVCFGRYDLVYIHFYTHVFFIVSLPLLIRRKKYVINIHGGEVFVISKHVKLLRDISIPFLTHAACIVVPSSYFKNVMVNNFHIAPDRFYVWPSGGVNDLFFNQQCPEKRNSKLKIGYVSRIDYNKGWDTLLKAFIAENDEWENRFELHFIGGGAEVNRFLSLADPYIKKGSLFYYGSLPHKEMVDIFKTFDLFVFPTMLKESLGLVGLEAMALGIPVVASHCGGISEYLVDKYNGMFFKGGNADEMRLKIELFKKMSDEEFFLYKKRALDTAADFKASVVSEKLVSLFNTLMPGHQS
jgi:glycosyltransferase involved in cell wall biosynthesis